MAINMDITTFLINYWEDTAKRNRAALYEYFHTDATIYLHDTNEKLEPVWFIDYDLGSEPDEEYRLAVDRVDKLENGQIVTITFHRSKSWVGFITSFFTLKDEKIIELHEYYSPCDDFIVPQWRTDLAEHEKIK